MSNPTMKNKLNVVGTFYCTDPDEPNGEGCIACGLCYGTSPEYFAEDDNGNAYVHNQPASEEEIEEAMERLRDCPVGSIGNNGDGE